jgi:hypothetical protein
LINGLFYPWEQTLSSYHSAECSLRHGGKTCNCDYEKYMSREDKLREVLVRVIEATKDWHSISDCEAEKRNCDLCKAIKLAKKILE